MMVQRALVLLAAATAAAWASSLNVVPTSGQQVVYQHEGLGQDFSIKYTHFVDKVVFLDGSANLMFRSNIPIIGKEFAYDAVLAAIKEKYKSEGHGELPDDFHFIDLSFLNALNYEHLAIEKSYWHDHKDQGELINWPLVGSIEDPHKTEQTDKEKMIEEAKTFAKWSMDKMPDRVAAVRKILETKASKPVIILNHCEAGTDRTGSFNASYSMKYLGMSYQEAIDYADHIRDRAIRAVSRYSAGWYCYWLKYSEGQAIDCELHHPPPADHVAE